MSAVKVVVIGQGYVGLTISLFASDKHQVLGFDLNSKIVAQLNSGNSHIEGVDSEVLIKRPDARTNYWKNKFGLSINKVIHPKLFRLLASYLDQGVAQWTFPINETSFLEALHKIECNGTFT